MHQLTGAFARTAGGAALQCKRARIVCARSGSPSRTLTMIKALASLAVLSFSVLSQIPGAMADNVPSNVVTDLAPSGKLRAAINFGNSVLAQKDRSEERRVGKECTTRWEKA